MINFTNLSFFNLLQFYFIVKYLILLQNILEDLTPLNCIQHSL